MVSARRHAGPHYDRGMRNFLDTEFFNRWIGRKGQIEWPPRSPNLSPLDYFLWGYLKGKVYAAKPRNLKELRRIIEEAALIAPEFLRNAISSFYDRIAHCQTSAQFEHLI